MRQKVFDLCHARMLVNRQTCGAKWVVCRLAHPAIQCKDALVQSKHVWFCKCSASLPDPSLLPRCPETPHLQTSILRQRIDPASPVAMGAIVAVAVARGRRPAHVRCTPVQSLRPELPHGDAVNSHRQTNRPRDQRPGTSRLSGQSLHALTAATVFHNNNTISEDHRRSFPTTRPACRTLHKPCWLPQPSVDPTTKKYDALDRQSMRCSAEIGSEDCSERHCGHGFRSCFKRESRRSLPRSQR
jgi:hypothetical protein